MQTRSWLRAGTPVLLAVPRGGITEHVGGSVAEAGVYGLTLSLIDADAGVVFPVGGELHGYVLSPARAYEIEVRVLEQTAGASPTVVVSHPLRVRSVQRRSFVRVHFLYDASVARYVGDGGGVVGEPVFATGVDISGGGGQLRLSYLQRAVWHEFIVGSRVRLEITLPPSGTEFAKGYRFTTDGKVVASVARRTFHRLGVSFLDLDRRERDTVVAWCFSVQLRLLRGGWYTQESGWLQ